MKYLDEKELEISEVSSCFCEEIRNVNTYQHTDRSQSNACQPYVWLIPHLQNIFAQIAGCKIIPVKHSLILVCQQGLQIICGKGDVFHTGQSL